MIYVEGENALTVLRRHHAFRTLPTVHALAATLFLGPLHQDRHHHRIVQSKTGAQSYSLHLADGRQFHFRGVSEHDHYDAIHVYDRWNYQRDGVPPEAILRTPDDAVRWAKRLKYNPLIAKAHGLPVRWPSPIKRGAPTVKGKTP